MSLKNKILIFCAGLVLTLNAGAQNTNNSPYSEYGIGDLNPQYYAAQAGMGGIGVSNANGFNINNINPALLARNNKFTAFEFGVYGKSQKLSSEGKTQNSVSGTLQYISLAFPVTSQKSDTSNLHWTTGLALSPYSNVYYKVVRPYYDPGVGLITYPANGTGGLTKIDFNNGFKLNKNWYLGLKISYIFGDVTKEGTASLANGGYPVTLIDRTNQHGFDFKFGSAYRKKLKEKLYFNAGLTYELSSKLNSTKLRYSQINISNPPQSDTLRSTDQGITKLPSQLQFGISIDDPYHWTIGADFSYVAGANADFSYISSSINTGTAIDKLTYSNGYSFTIGGEYTPNIFSYNLISRMTYRAGVNYSITPITINNNQITDMSASVGTSLPIGRGNTLVNLALSMGKRGSSAYVQENYFRVNLGITINDQWFKRRKID